jgi:hypothetical protein
MQTYRKIAVAGVTVAAVVGGGTAAAVAASSGSSSTNGSGSQASAHRHKHPRLVRHLVRGVHGQVVTHGKNGYVTHSAVRGTVSAVSATAITVQAADGYRQTFTINKDTRVRERPTSGTGKGRPGTISDVKSGDRVGVLGKKAEHSTARSTATVVIDGLRK